MGTGAGRWAYDDDRHPDLFARHPAAIAEWALAMRADRVAVATIDLRIQTMECLTRWAGKTDPVGLTAEDVAAYMSRPVKAWTKVTYHRNIKAWDAWARATGRITESIVEGIPAPSRPATRPKPFSDSEARAVLAARPLTGRARQLATAKPSP